MEFSIEEKLLGDDHPPYLIAELSANHNGSIDRAKESIRAAKESGAQAVKLQTYTADTMTIDCDKEDFLQLNLEMHLINNLPRNQMIRW